jgi:hypothetical protein
MKNAELAKLIAFPDEVDVQPNVLRSLVMNRV